MRLLSLTLILLLTLTVSCKTPQTTTTSSSATGSTMSHSSTPTTSAAEAIRTIRQTCRSTTTSSPWTPIEGAQLVPVHCVVIDGVVYHQPGYWISTDGLAVLKESYEGEVEKNQVLREVEVHRGMRPLDVILVGAGALVVGVGGGVVLGVVVD